MALPSLAMTSLSVVSPVMAFVLRPAHHRIIHVQNALCLKHYPPCEGDVNKALGAVPY
jgi:hypothetical protein